MREALLAVCAVALVTLAAPQANATGAAPAGGSSAEHCQQYQIAKVIAVVDAGNVDVCLIFDTEVVAGQDFFVGGRSDGPDNLAGTLTMTWSVVSSSGSGCTTGTLTQTSFQGAATSGSNARVPVTMTGTHCRGALEFVLANGATTLVDFIGEWNTDQLFTEIQTRECAASSIGASCTTPEVDNQNRLCAASALGASCSTPTINAAVTGTLTVTNAGGQTMTVTGTLDVLDRLCAAAATGSTCNVATVNTPLSGTVNVAQSGAWTVTDNVAGGLTVTNAGGQTLTVHQDPISGTLTLSGTVLPCSTAALGADANACRVDMHGNLTNNVFGNQTMHFPDTLNIQGAGKATLAVDQADEAWIELALVAVLAYAAYRRHDELVPTLLFAAAAIFVAATAAIAPATKLMLVVFAIYSLVRTLFPTKKQLGMTRNA